MIDYNNFLKSHVSLSLLQIYESVPFIPFAFLLADYMQVAYSNAKPHLD